VTRTPFSSSKGQGHQATLLTAALTHEAGAAVTVRTYWAWETTASLRLLGGARGAVAPTAEDRGGAYRVATRTACCCYYYYYKILVSGILIRYVIECFMPVIINHYTAR